MRKLAASLLCLVAACASAPPASVPAALRGCYIEHRGADTITMRWFLKSGSATSWHGDELFYRTGSETSHQGFDLDATAGEHEQFGWAVCPLDDGMPHGPPCMRAFFGRGHVDGDDNEWMELHVSAHHMALIAVNSGVRMLLFDGARDGCD